MTYRRYEENLELLERPWKLSDTDTRYIGKGDFVLLHEHVSALKAIPSNERTPEHDQELKNISVARDNLAQDLFGANEVGRTGELGPNERALAYAEDPRRVARVIKERGTELPKDIAESRAKFHLAEVEGYETCAHEAKQDLRAYEAELAADYGDKLGVIRQAHADRRLVVERNVSVPEDELASEVQLEDGKTGILIEEADKQDIFGGTQNTQEKINRLENMARSSQSIGETLAQQHELELAELAPEREIDLADETL